MIKLDSDDEGENDDYFYFLAKRTGKYLVDPLSDPKNFYFEAEEAMNDEDHDSQDSNRESHEANDYPDEE